MRSGFGALPSKANCLNFSRLKGQNALKFENLLLPVAGNVAGAGNA